MAEMARHVRTRIRYDGAVLADHEKDVQDLAPALLAMAEIVQIANRKFNGDAAPPHPDRFHFLSGHCVCDMAAVACRDGKPPKLSGSKLNEGPFSGAVILTANGSYGRKAE